VTAPATASPDTALYFGRDYAGGFSKRPVGYIPYDAAGKKLKPETSQRGAVDAIIAAAKPKAVTIH
jgi:hypothetical protein